MTCNKCSSYVGKKLILEPVKLVLHELLQLLAKLK